MFHTRSFYSLLGVPETVVEPTAYELLSLRPDQVSPPLVEHALREREKQLRLSTPGPSFVPVMAAFEERLEEAASILFDPKQRRAYDAHLASRGRRRALKTAEARHLQRIAAVLDATNAALAPDGTLGEERRPALFQQLLEIGVSARNAEAILGEIPGPDPTQPPAEPSRETLFFFMGAVDLAMRLGVLAGDDERQLAELAGRLAIPREAASRAVEDRLQAWGAQRDGSGAAAPQGGFEQSPQPGPPALSPAGARRTDPGAAARRERFAEELHKLYPERAATPKQRASLRALGIAQGAEPDEVDAVLRDYFEPPPPPPPAVAAQAPFRAPAPAEEVELILADPDSPSPAAQHVPAAPPRPIPGAPPPAHAVAPRDDLKVVLLEPDSPPPPAQRVPAWPPRPAAGAPTPARAPAPRDEVKVVLVGPAPPPRAAQAIPEARVVVIQDEAPGEEKGPGTFCAQVPGSGLQVPGWVRHPEPGTSSPAPGTRHLQPGTRNPAPGTILQKVPGPFSSPRSVWFGVGALVAAALVLGLTLIFVVSASHGTRPPEPPQNLADRLVAAARSLPQVRGIVSAAKPDDLAEALRRVAHAAASPDSPMSADALEVLAQIVRDPPEEGLAPEARRAAASALCQVIRETREAGTAHKARDGVFRLVRVGVPLPPGLATSDLSTSAERQQAATELEKAILGSRRLPGTPP
jgi:hypothetical protein